MTSELPPIEINSPVYIQQVCNEKTQKEMHMSLLTRQICDPILQTRTRDADFQKDASKIHQDYGKMLSTLREQKGVGIASNQCADIDEPLRMTIIGTDNEEVRQAFFEAMPEDELPLPFLMINPEILDVSEEIYFPAKGEGCLSVLGPILGKVARHYSIHVKFFDAEGTEHEEVFHGFPAHIIQHELDHINKGLLFFEKILSECSQSQKEEMLNCIALYEKGLIKENEDEHQKTGLSFDRDESGKVVFYPETFKMALLKISPETLTGVKECLMSYN